METTPDDWWLPAAMERGVFSMADQVLIPVPGHRQVMLDRYGVMPDRLMVSPPPIPPLDGEAAPPIGDCRCSPPWGD